MFINPKAAVVNFTTAAFLYTSYFSNSQLAVTKTLCNTPTAIMVVKYTGCGIS